MNHDEAKAALNRCYRKVSVWRRAVYLGLFATVLFAVIAFLIRVGTGNYIFPVILSGCMILAALFVGISLCKMQFWQDKTERQALDVSLWDFQC